MAGPTGLSPHGFTASLRSTAAAFAVVLRNFEQSPAFVLKRCDQPALEFIFITYYRGFVHHLVTLFAPAWAGSLLGTLTQKRLAFAQTWR
ncbi:MAG TPA: hypothetical protein VMF66_19595 [Candidatus Acidoferrum sp.]|nr:hypothetical protein [Candidatus Acidoferrum sp.]